MNEPAAPVDLLPGFAARRIETADGHIAARIGGAGPPLLLLHGYPETHLAWHKVAGPLAGRFTVVVPDLRGYGASACPPTDAAHRPYAKRAMAAEMVAVMGALGHARFAVMGHDRGARVAYRMALDERSRVERLVLVDILTTLDYWSAMGATGTSLHHWPLLTQPAPIPETLIAADVAGWIEGRLRRGARGRSLAAFDHRALAAYGAALADPDRLHATCEDHRAGATADLDDDRADCASNRRIACPTLVVAASHGSLAGLDAGRYWRPWCARVEVAVVESGHFVPEEAPAGLLAAVSPFLPAGRTGT